MLKLTARIRVQRLFGSLEKVASEGSGGPLQAKTAWPSHDEQVIAPDEDYYGLVSVKVMPVPRLPAAVASFSEGIRETIENVVNLAVGVSVKTPSGIEYYYNHEHLPEIPADVVENYPYIVIMKNLTYTRIYASKGKFYYTVTDAGVEKLYDNAPGTGVRYTYNADAKAWMLDSVATGQFNFSMNGDGNWAIWWSNHDIPKGSPDSEEIYFPASEVKVEQPAAATQYYYNGDKIPAIPFDILNDYPYAFIHKGSTRYNLVFSKEKYWYQSSDDTCQNSDGTVKNYWLTFENMAAGQTWSHRNDEWYYWENFSNSVLWANYDIPAGSADSTGIYFYGTHAVPNPA